MSHLPHTDAERSEMLAAIGVRRLDDLFERLPRETRCGELNLPLGLGEMELSAELARLGAGNRSCRELVCFLGAGAYDHFIPPAVLELAARGELYTAYTPYQPEISQGVLQLIYEYQTMIASLCGCDVANASLYDGATALEEGVQMAVRHTRRHGRVVLDGALHPHYLDTVRPALRMLGVAYTVVAPRSGGYSSDLSGLARAAQEAGSDLACVAVGYPNFYGALDDLTELAEAVHRGGALLVAAANPFALGLLRPPGASENDPGMSADIVCGEAQALGVPMQFGGPYLGYLACRQALVRRLPGRLVGKTVDARGQEAYTLTLQAREQHIRREKATSNICTNQALCAMMAHFYLSALGRGGLRRAGELCLAKADLLRQKLKGAKGVRAVPAYPVFHEFVFETERPAKDVLAALLKKGMLGGLDLGRYEKARAHQILVCVTEKRSVEEIERYVEALGSSGLPVGC